MKSKWKECPEIPHAQSLSIMHMMDFIRKQLGISYEDVQTSPLPGLPDTGETNSMQISDMSAGTPRSDVVIGTAVVVGEEEDEAVTQEDERQQEQAAAGPNTDEADTNAGGEREELPPDPYWNEEDQY